MDIPPTAPATSAVEVKAARIDIVTVAAIACIGTLCSSFAHEALGHGLFALLLGLHPTRLTSVSLDVSLVGVAFWKVKVVAAAGSSMQFVLGLIALWLRRFVPKQQVHLRFFLWTFSVQSLLVVASYLTVPTLLGYGDWVIFVQGMPVSDVLTIALIALGVVLYVLTFLLCSRALNEFAGWEIRDSNARWRRHARVLYTVYLSTALINTVSALFNPTGLGPNAAFAYFGGMAPIMLLFSIGNKPRATTITREGPLTPTHSWPWIIAGLLAAIIQIAVLGPGLPRP